MPTYPQSEAPLGDAKTPHESLRTNQRLIRQAVSDGTSSTRFRRVVEWLQDGFLGDGTIIDRARQMGARR